MEIQLSSGYVEPSNTVDQGKSNRIEVSRYNEFHTPGACGNACSRSNDGVPAETSDVRRNDEF